MAKIPFDLKGKSVFVAGHRGMVGAALVRRLAREGVELLTVAHRELDLRDQAGVSGWFAAVFGMIIIAWPVRPQPKSAGSSPTAERVRIRSDAANRGASGHMSHTLGH